MIPNNQSKSTSHAKKKEGIIHNQEKTIYRKKHRNDRNELVVKNF